MAGSEATQGLNGVKCHTTSQNLHLVYRRIGSICGYKNLECLVGLLQPLSEEALKDIEGKNVFVKSSNASGEIA